MDKSKRLALFVSELVRGMQAQARIGNDAKDDRVRHALSASLRRSNQLLEGIAIHPFEHLKERFSLFAKFKCLRHVRVLDQRGDTCLAYEHFAELRIVRQLGQNRLYCEELSKSLRARQSASPNRAHTAARDGEKKFVAPQAGPGHVNRSFAHRARGGRRLSAAAGERGAPRRIAHGAMTPRAGTGPARPATRMRNNERFHEPVPHTVRRSEPKRQAVATARFTLPSTARRALLFRGLPGMVFLASGQRVASALASVKRVSDVSVESVGP